MANAYEKSVCIVTGGASGIGKGITVELAGRGAFVSIFSRNQQNGAQTVEEIQKAGGKAEFRRVDVTDAATMKKNVDEVAATNGRIDYLFNNAGIGIMGFAQDLSVDDWRQVMDVNVMGVVHGIAATYPLMIAQKSGHIVNVSSLAGLVPTPGSVPYAASKFAVVGLSHALRIEAAQHGVRVSVVCPAMVETPIFDTNTFVRLDREKFKALVPGGADSPAKFAKTVLNAVSRNKATIAPGFASLLWAAHRYTPSLTQAMSSSLVTKLAGIRLEA